jgi:methylphosphotriester-DNA--protein-cysteine methyltransferase
VDREPRALHVELAAAGVTGFIYVVVDMGLSYAWPDTAQAGLSESGFRPAHRALRGTPAGATLTVLRLSTAERLLATTALSLAEIAAAVGYGHAATLSYAFRRSRRLSPGAWRRAQRPFA